MKFVNRVSEQFNNFLNLAFSFPLSGSYSSPSTFRISAKNDKELHLAHGEEYLPTFSLSLRCTVLRSAQCCALGGVLVLVFAS